jgi:hypothetical protein
LKLAARVVLLNECSFTSAPQRRRDPLGCSFMRLVMRLLPAMVLVTTLDFSPLTAQRAHQGFWIGFAPGGVGVADGEGLAYPLYLRLGGTVRQQVLIGLEWYGVIIDPDPSAVAANLTAMALFYPSHQGGFFAKAGVGLGQATSYCPNASYFDVASGVGVTLGAGADIRIGRNVYLTPNIDLLWQGAERVLCPAPGQPDAGPVRSYSPGYFFTVGITWH